jgi:mannose-6-phosphate isomerase-like protein (cupin superfamily)
MVRSTKLAGAVLALAVAGGAARAQAPAQGVSPTAGQPTPVIAAADVQRQIADMEAVMKDGRHFLWRPVVRDGKTIAALEYWAAPGKPAIHPGLAEYVIVMAGSGTLVSGGRMTDQTPVNAGQIDGGRIEGGVSRHLQPGDVFLVPPGVPHWFGIDGGKLVLLGVKIPEPATP